MGDSDSDQDPHATPEAGLEREESKQFGRIELYRAFITGTEARAAQWFAAKPADVERYVECFRQRDEVGGIRLGWHWPALFFALP